MLDYQGVLYIKIGDLTYPIPFKEVTHPYVYREAEKWLNDGFADRMELRWKKEMLPAEWKASWYQGEFVNSQTR